jgi:hypothetical protein
MNQRLLLEIKLLLERANDRLAGGRNDFLP